MRRVDVRGDGEPSNHVDLKVEHPLACQKSMPLNWVSESFHSPLTSVTVYSIPPARKTYAYSARRVVLKRIVFSTALHRVDIRDDPCFLFSQFKVRIREKEEHLSQLAYHSLISIFSLV